MWGVVGMLKSQKNYGLVQRFTQKCKASSYLEGQDWLTKSSNVGWTTHGIENGSVAGTGKAWVGSGIPVLRMKGIDLILWHARRIAGRTFKMKTKWIDNEAVRRKPISQRTLSCVHLYESFDHNRQTKTLLCWVFKCHFGNSSLIKPYGSKDAGDSDWDNLISEMQSNSFISLLDTKHFLLDIGANCTTCICWL